MATLTSQKPQASNLVDDSDKEEFISPQAQLNIDGVSLSLQHKHEEAIKKYTQAISETNDSDQ